MIYLGDKAVGLNTGLDDAYNWKKPPQWPDLESVPLPGSWTVNTLYFLYDRKCGIDEVDIKGARMTVYKGFVENGEFIGEQIAENTSNFNDSLTNEYTVYKITQTVETPITFGNNAAYSVNYSWMKQGCVWIYGELPKARNIGGTSGPSLLTPYLRRINFSHVQNMYFTFPENDHCFIASSSPWSISVSYVCGYQQPNDWGGLPVSRTGNGPITPPIKQNSDYVVRNVNFQNSYDRAAITAKKIILDNPSGTIRSGQYRNDKIIEKFICNNGTAKMLNAQSQFCYAINLKKCDLSGIDFTETSRSDGFLDGCWSLQTLVLNDSWTLPLNLGGCPNLSHESLINLFNTLPTITSNNKITLNRYVFTNLTDQERQIVTSKGWVVTQ